MTHPTKTCPSCNGSGKKNGDGPGICEAYEDGRLCCNGSGKVTVSLEDLKFENIPKVEETADNGCCILPSLLDTFERLFGRVPEHGTSEYELLKSISDHMVNMRKTIEILGSKNIAK